MKSENERRLSQLIEKLERKAFGRFIAPNPQYFDKNDPVQSTILELRAILQDEETHEGR